MVLQGQYLREMEPGNGQISLLWNVGNSILIRSNKMQQYVGIYLLQIYCRYFGCTSHPSSRVHWTVNAASDTGHNIWATAFLQRGL